jgi:hypothetical protein
MAVSVKKVTLWHKEASDVPGTLATTLEPLANAGADLQIVIGRGTAIAPASMQAEIAVHPISGKKATGAAEQAGLSAWSLPALLVEGDNRPGMGHSIARALGDAGINLAYVMVLVMGRRFSALFGFENSADASRASALIKKSSAPPPKRTGKGR